MQSAMREGKGEQIAGGLEENDGRDLQALVYLAGKSRVLATGVSILFQFYREKQEAAGVPGVEGGGANQSPLRVSNDFSI